MSPKPDGPKSGTARVDLDAVEARLARIPPADPNHFPRLIGGWYVEDMPAMVAELRAAREVADVAVPLAALLRGMGHGPGMAWVVSHDQSLCLWCRLVRVVEESPSARPASGPPGRSGGAGGDAPSGADAEAGVHVPADPAPDHQSPATREGNG